MQGNQKGKKEGRRGLLSNKIESNVTAALSFPNHKLPVTDYNPAVHIMLFIPQRYVAGTKLLHQMLIQNKQTYSDTYQHMKKHVLQVIKQCMVNIPKKRNSFAPSWSNG